MHDNHHLVLKLRYVVINVDPKSTTSPQAIVDRWNGNNNSNKLNNYNYNYNLNMTIVLWNDTNYINPIKYEFEQAKIEGAEGAAKYELATKYHKYRQPEFYKACSKHLIEQRQQQQQQQQNNNNNNNNNNSKTTATTTHNTPPSSLWTSYHDTDEFVSFAPEMITADTNILDTTAEKWKKYQSLGYVLRRLNAIKSRGMLFVAEKKKKDANANANANNTAAITVDTSISPSGLSCLLLQRKKVCSIELNEKKTYDWYKIDEHPPSPASLSLLLSSNDNTNINIYTNISAAVPSEFVKEKILLEHGEKKKQAQRQTQIVDNDNQNDNIVQRFDTLRYKYRASGLGTSGKSIVDLSQPNIQEFVMDKFDHTWYTHEVISNVCKNENDEKINKIANNNKYRSRKVQKLIQHERMVRILLYVCKIVCKVYYGYMCVCVCVCMYVR